MYSALLLVASACTKPVDYDPGTIVETGGDDGIVFPDVDLPSGETEGEPDPVLVPPGECLSFPKAYAYGYVHQCEGTIQLKFTAQNDSGEDAFTFGPGASNPTYWIEPDSYDLPLVAACCGPFDYDNPTFEQKAPYLNNCLFDAAQQVCRAIPHFLRRQAEMADDLITEALINAAANDAEKKHDECLTKLWNGGPAEENPTRLIGTSWSPRSDVTITLVDAEVYDWTEAGEVEWNTCAGFYDNDTAVIPTAPFQVPGSIAMTQANLAPGTTMSGTGPGGVTAIVLPSTINSSLTLAHMGDGTLRVSGLRLEAGPSAVSFNGDDFMLERSSVLLGEVMAPRVAGGEYTMDIGDAHFVVTAVFEGDSRIVNFSNTDPIVFRRTRLGDWEFDPFDLSYDEPGIGTWTLSFDGLLFRRAR